MNKFALLLPVFAFAACSPEPAAEPTPTATAAAPAPTATASLPAPDQALFTKMFAEACPEAAAVNTAVCKRAGLGSEEVICEFGLGEDEFLRNTATLVAGESAWTLKDAPAVCEAAK